MEITPGRAMRVGFGLFAALAGVVFLASYLGIHVLGPNAGKAVALVRLEGPILDSREVVKEIRIHQKDRRVRALVLRIDSPGGGVVASQEIHDQVAAFQASGKPVVVSMGTVAASGGYYAAVPAQVIMANPGTLTGSIGVIMSLTNLEGLMGKIGIHNVTIKAGSNKDVGSPFRAMTDAEKALLQNVIDDIHEQFIEAVAEGRKRPIDTIRPLADGRVFTGRQALEVGLVDAIGNLDDATLKAGELAGIVGRPKVIAWHKSPWRQFLDDINGLFPWSARMGARWGGAPQAMYWMAP